MNYVQGLLKKYFPPEYIEIVAMDERARDIRWMIEKGYREDFRIDKRGFRDYGDLTPSGKKYIAESEKKYSALCAKLEKKMSLEEESRAESTVKKLLIEYIKSHPDKNYTDGLSYAERAVCYKLLEWINLR